MASHAEAAFRSQEASLFSSRAELTAASERAACQQARVMALERQLDHVRAGYQHNCAAFQGATEAERTITQPMCDARRRAGELARLESELTHMARIH